MADDTPKMTEVFRVAAMSRVAQKPDGTWEPVLEGDPRYETAQWVLMHDLTIIDGEVERPCVVPWVIE